MLAHISTEYYTRLEQGRAPRPSGEVCEAIARALRLTEAETDHLFVLAGTASTRRRLHRRDVRPSIVALLHRMPQTPAFVLSAAYEVLAWNNLAAALMEDFGAVQPGHRNLARKAFLGPPHAQPIYGIAEDADFRLSVVMQLRATLARYPHDPEISELVDDLVEGSVQAPPMLTKTFNNPVVGSLTLDCDSVILPERDQHLVLYSAPTDSAAAEALTLLEIASTPQTAAG